MVNEVTPALLKSQVDTAADNLHKVILAAESPDTIALTRAVYQYKNTKCTSPNSRNALIGKRPFNVVLQNLHNDAVTHAQAVVAFDSNASTSANRQAHADRRKAYVDYLDTITKQFDRFYEVYKKISPVPPFPKSSLTSIYLTALRAQVLAWYDSKLASKQIPDRQPQDGIVRFMNEHREFVMLLKTAHAKAKDGPDRQMALDACLLQLTLAPVVALVVGLYKPWDGAKILEFKSLTELERAVLALAFFVPSAARIVKSGRAVYTTDRLALIYGGDPSLWDQAIRYCTVLSENRGWQRALDVAYKAMEPGKKLSGQEQSDASVAMPKIVASSSEPGFSDPITVEPWITQLWTELKSNHSWLADAMLDDCTLRRALLMGPNPSLIQSQLLAELAESRIATFLGKKTGAYALGISASVPDGCALEFVPGHAFRAGDKNIDIKNRQLSDGVIGYWDKDGFHVVALLEAKMDGTGGRELGHVKTTLSSLTPDERARLRAFARRVSVEDKEVADRQEAEVSKTFEDYELEILRLEIGSQVSRDIDRLENLGQVRVNGVLGPLPLLQDPRSSIKVFAVVAKNIEPTELENEVQVVNTKRQPQTPIQFEPLAVPVEATQLKKLAEAILPKAKDMASTSTPAEFAFYIAVVYILSRKYSPTGNSDTRVMDWLRHAEYKDFAFRWLVPIEDVWINYVTRTIKEIDMLLFVSDPRYPINIKASHFGYAMQAVMKYGLPPVDDFNLGDIGGWGGDWITFYAEWQRDKVMPGSKYCRDRLARPGDAGTFKLRDMTEDVDGFNIAHALLTNATNAAGTKQTIVDEVGDLFKRGGGYTTRFSRFFESRFGKQKKNAVAAALNVLIKNLQNEFSFGVAEAVYGRRSIIDKIAKGAGMKIKYPADINRLDLLDFCEGFAEVLMGLAAKG